MPDHEEICPYKTKSCPLKEIPGMRCKWEGLLQNLKAHINDEHRTLLKEQQFVRFSKGSNVNLVISHDGDEVFVFYRKRRNRRYYGVVQRVGMSRKLYTCQITFSCPNGINMIIFTFVVPSVHLSLRSLLRSGGTFSLSEHVMRNFYRQDGAEALVSIKNGMGHSVS
jgi:hypothetical protein